MPFEADSLGFRTTAVFLLRDLVHERTGLHYDNERSDNMAERLTPLVRAKGFGSFLDYYYYLKYDLGAASEWPRILDALSVPETYFWREVDQLHAVVDLLLPAIAARRAGTIRIWCVPCATGEEPLTLAMLLEEAGWFDRADIEIRASDGSMAALGRAREGVYRARSFRAIPTSLQARYFSQEPAGWRIDPAIHARIREWAHVNLLDDADVRPRAAVDIILCRNVFIYFSDASIRRVVELFADTMASPGYLCVGAAESLLRITDRFDLRQLGDAFVYVKEPGPQGAV